MIANNHDYPGDLRDIRDTDRDTPDSPDNQDRPTESDRSPEVDSFHPDRGESDKETVPDTDDILDPEKLFSTALTRPKVQAQKEDPDNNCLDTTNSRTDLVCISSFPASKTKRKRGRPRKCDFLLPAKEIDKNVEFWNNWRLPRPDSQKHDSE